jgi:prepilin peptidase CpaA
MHLNANQVIWAFTLAFAFCAGWLDGLTSRIPNWLTLTGFFAGTAVHSIFGGLRGTATALEGAIFAMLALLPLVLLRALGAGDWKLMGAMGALVGPHMLWFVLFASVIVAGVMAVVLMIRARRVRQTLHNVGMLISGFLALGFRSHPEISLDNPGLLKLPFGVAAAIGTLICFVAAQWGL